MIKAFGPYIPKYPNTTKRQTWKEPDLNPLIRVRGRSYKREGVNREWTHSLIHFIHFIHSLIHSIIHRIYIYTYTYTVTMSTSTTTRITTRSSIKRKTRNSLGLRSIHATTAAATTTKRSRTPRYLTVPELEYDPVNPVVPPIRDNDDMEFDLYNVQRDRSGFENFGAPTTEEEEEEEEITYSPHSPSYNPLDDDVDPYSPQSPSYNPLNDDDVEIPYSPQSPSYNPLDDGNDNNVDNREFVPAPAPAPVPVPAPAPAPAPAIFIDLTGVSDAPVVFIDLTLDDEDAWERTDY